MSWHLLCLAVVCIGLQTVSADQQSEVVLCVLNSRYEDLLVSGFTSLRGLEGDRRNTWVEHSPMLSDKSHQLQASLKLKIAGGGKSAQRKIYILVLYLLSLAICVRPLVLFGCLFVFPGQNCHKLCSAVPCSSLNCRGWLREREQGLDLPWEN